MSCPLCGPPIFPLLVVDIEESEYRTVLEYRKQDLYTLLPTFAFFFCQWRTSKAVTAGRYDRADI